MNPHAMYLSTPMTEHAYFKDTVEPLIPEKLKSGPLILAGTGVSGTLALGILLATTPHEIAIVRKPDDDTHSLKTIEFSSSVEFSTPWLFLDDLIETGSTVSRVHRVMTKAGYDNFQGAVLYAHLDREFIPADVVELRYL